MALHDPLRLACKEIGPIRPPIQFNP